MLRFLLVLLVVANGAYALWASRSLAALGWAPAVQREPERLGSQILPKAVTALPANRSPQAPQADAQPTIGPVAPVSAAAMCLHSDVLTEQALATAKPLLAQLPAGAYTTQDAIEPGQWLVYMGKYPNEGALNKKLSELRELKIKPTVLMQGSLAPGLSLGRYPNQAAAQTALAQWSARGIRTAKVTAVAPQTAGKRIVLPNVNDTLREQLGGENAAIGSLRLSACSSSADAPGRQPGAGR